MEDLREISLLQELEKSNIICSSEVLENIRMFKVKKVLEVHSEKFYPRKDDGRVFTKVLDNEMSKQISGKNEQELFEKLYEFYFGKLNSSMEIIYPEWQKWRAEETGVTEKTIRENGYMWNALLRDTDIVKVPLKNLTPKNYTIFFRHITKDGNMTRKRFNDLKSIMNGIIYYAIEEEIISHNHLRDINYRQFKYKAENSNIIPYNEEERNQVIEYFGNDLLSLAVKLDFFLPLRIGEVKALRFDDVVGDFIFVQRFMNDKNKIINDIKGHQSEGKRYIPLTKTAKFIIEQARKINPNSEYIFIKDGKPIVTSTFNRRLKKCCDHLGIDYRSSHKVRFSTASILNKNGVEAIELQKMLGHTTLTMTNHYLRNVTPMLETSKKMAEIFG